MGDKKNKNVHEPKSRSPLYRFCVVHREISMGAYPNANDLAAILEVSYKTILRDIEALRYQYGFPIKYNQKWKGFYYDTADGSSFDVIYWQSMFSRMSSFAMGEGKDNQEELVACCSYIELDPKKNVILKKLINALQMHSLLEIRDGVNIFRARPIAIYKKTNDWYCALGSEYMAIDFSLPFSAIKIDSNGKILAHRSDSTPFIRRLTQENECNCQRNTEVCMCMVAGMFKTCLNVNKTRAIVSNCSNL